MMVKKFGVCDMEECQYWIPSDDGGCGFCTYAPDKCIYDGTKEGKEKDDA